MWLLHTKTRKLEHFVDEVEQHGRYAILSHTWQDEEITFQDIERGTGTQKRGYAKIEHSCRLAIADGLEYCWIDTCCIDKTSSAELSEAINSMYRWYHQACVCYAYLSDVSLDDDLSFFAQSRWFTRGWTLQELIAPAELNFYDNCWRPIGSKSGMIAELSEITKVDQNVLGDRSMLSSVSVASRMSWAAYRSTSREEDRAYSLLGIFDVNMPMLYGEGSKAFFRLQEEILRRSTDHSILAWKPWEDAQSRLLFAPSPYGFRLAHDIISWSAPDFDDSFELSNKGLRISLPIFESQSFCMAVLNCRFAHDSQSDITLLLQKYEADRVSYDGPPGGSSVGSRTGREGSILSGSSDNSSANLADNHYSKPVQRARNTVCHISPMLDKFDGGLSHIRRIDRKHIASATWRDLIVLRRAAPSHKRAQRPIWTELHINEPGNAFEVLNWSRNTAAWDAPNSTMFMVPTGSPGDDMGFIVLGERAGTGLAGGRRLMLAFEHEIRHATASLRIYLSAGSYRAPGPKGNFNAWLAPTPSSEVWDWLSGALDENPTPLESTTYLGRKDLVRATAERDLASEEVAWTITLLTGQAALAVNPASQGSTPTAETLGLMGNSPPSELVAALTRERDTMSTVGSEMGALSVVGSESTERSEKSERKLGRRRLKDRLRDR